MTLMHDDLGTIAKAVRLGRRTVHVIQADVAIALSLKAVFFALAVTGHANLWLADLADTGATLVVIADSLRLLNGANS